MIRQKNFSFIAIALIWFVSAPAGGSGSHISAISDVGCSETLTKLPWLQRLHRSYLYHKWRIQNRVRRSIGNRSGYYSQFGQDRWLAEKVFPEVTGGVFVEAGAYDGVKLSNTYYLEKSRGWKGILIEPIQEQFAKLRQNRTANCFWGCLAGRSGPRRFSFVQLPHGTDESMLSGFSDSYSDQQRRRLEREVQRNKGQIEEITIEARTFDQVVGPLGFSHIDYMSLDTEGSEMEILRSIDFERYSISVLGVEDNDNDPRIENFLKTKGYRLVNRMGVDEFYFHRDFRPALKR